MVETIGSGSVPRKLLTDVPETVLVLEPIPEQKTAAAPVEVSGWCVLQIAGLLFLVVGGVDVALVWYPTNFGQPEWEFGSVTATLNGLPAPAIGLALITGAALALRHIRLARVLAVAFGVLAVAIVAAALLYVTNIPFALQAAPEGSAVATGIKRAILKSAIQSLAYPATFVWIAAMTWRRATRARP